MVIVATWVRRGNNCRRCVPVGPCATGEPDHVKVLPLRMTAAEVAALDDAWRRLGFKSRTAMIRKAIEAMLAP